MQIAIVGLGLMGGSFALGVKNDTNRVVGYDHSAKNKEQALNLRLVDAVVDFDEVKKSDIIILAIPVEGIIKTLHQLQDISSETTVIDLGSTKEVIVAAIPPSIRQNVVAAHPMTGTEKHGPKAAFDGLYEGKIVVLCNTQDNATLHKNRAHQIFQTLSMKIVSMDAKEHDLHAAFISHMPHALSFALARAVLTQQDPRSILTLAAGGFKDMSRLAKSSPKMWSDIFKQNSDNLLESIECFESELAKCKKMVQDGDFEAMEEWIKEANKLHHIL
ncbi:MAG: prephenate dehydrogenase [Campylobacterota bacterium]